MIYDPTFEVTPEQAGTVVVVIRDPDSSNEYKAWGRRAGNVICVDIDAGADDLSDPAVYEEWADGLYARANTLRHTGWLEACDYIIDVIRNYDPEEN